MSEDITQQLAYHPVAAKDKTVEVRLWKGIPNSGLFTDSRGAEHEL